MKSLSLLLFIFFLPLFSMAQNNGAIKGTIIDKTNGEAIPFCNVALYNDSFIFQKSAMSDFDGVYNFNSLDSGNYFLVFKYVGYYNDTATVHLKKGETYSLKTILRAMLNFDLHDGPYEYKEPLIEPNTLPGGTVTREEFFSGNLTGKISDAKSLEGIPFAKVTCLQYPNDFHTVADIDGKYFIRGLPQGKYLIDIQILNCGEKIIPVYIAAGKTDSLNAALCCHEVPIQELSGVTNDQSPEHPKAISSIVKDSVHPNDSLLSTIYQISHAHRRGNFHNYYFLAHSELKQFDDSTFYFDYNEFGCSSSVLYMKKGNKYFKANNSAIDGPSEFTIQKKKKHLELKCKGAKARLISQE